MSIEINGAGVITGVDSLSTPAVTNTAGSASAPSITFTGDTNTGIYSPGADQVAISTNSSGRLFIDANGNVGINTASTIAPGGFGYAREFALTGATSGDSSAAINIRGSRTVSGGFGDINFWHQSTSNRAYIQARRGSSDSAIDLDFITSGGAGMRITSAGLVGVGTSSPLALLDVRGNVYVTGNGTSRQTLAVVNTGGAFESGVESSAGGAVFTGSTAYASIIGSQNSTPLQFGTNGVIRATLDTSGRLGIGDSAPGTFDVRGAKLTLADSTSDGIGIKGRRDSLDRWYVGYNSSDHLEINQIRNNTLAFKTNNTEVARLTNSGQLLVGTSSARANFFNASDASAVLQIEGSGTGRRASILGTSDGYPYLILGRQRGSVGQNVVVNSGDGVGAISFQGSDGTEFVEAATITAEVDGTPGANDMPGRLVFSVTRDGQASPTERLRISNAGTVQVYDSSSNGLNVRTESASGTGANLIGGYYSATNTTTGTNCFAVFANGNVQNTNNSYGALSDIKLKENIVDAGSQWSDIKALQVRKYNFKEGQTHTQIGLVAQEAELVSPGLVGESPDRDAEGNDLGTVTKSVNYSVLYMKAVKALQEAMERIETLEAKVAALETK